MDTFSQRLKDLLSIKDITQAELSRISGVNKSSISRYLKGDWKAKQDAVYAIAKATSTNEAWLMGYDVPMEKVASKQSSFNVGSENFPALTPYHPSKRIPILGRVAAGLPLLAEENIEGYTSIDFDDDEVYYALRVRGDSMNAVGINDGDLVVVRQQSAVDDGQIAVVLVNGDDATIKYIKQEGNLVFLTPKSYNPAHQIQVYNLDETPVHIIGRVVSCQRYY